MPDESISLGESVEPIVWPEWLERLIAWFGSRQRHVILAAVVLNLGILASMVALRSLPFFFGETIVLKVQPVDPRDLFRGEYVILSYEIGRVPSEGIEGIPEASNRWSRRWNRDQWLEERTVYVTLEPDPDGKHWHGVKASVERPSAGRYIKGKFSRRRFWQGGIQFGIEAYYVLEGRGKELEQARNARHLAAEVVLAPWGKAALRRLIVEE